MSNDLNVWHHESKRSFDNPVAPPPALYVFGECKTVNGEQGLNYVCRA